MRSKEKVSSTSSKQTRGGSRMNRLYILLTVMVVMVGTLFAGQEALAKVLTGTAGADTLVGTDGTTQSRVAAATTQSPPAKATITYTPAPATTISSRATPTAWIS